MQHTTEVVVLQPLVQTLQVASPVPAYLGTAEMDLRVKVSQTKIRPLLRHNAESRLTEYKAKWTEGFIVISC